MSNYKVTNDTKAILWFRDGLWNSGDMHAGDTRTFETNHDANVTLFEKIEGKDREIGKAWIPMNGHIVVQGEWTWSVKR